jgi:hypothetical protein
MKAEDTSFLNLLGGGSRQFVIPVFQRQYSWTETQSSQLLGDVVRVARRPQGATHFLGSVVYVASGDHSAVLPQWLVIDGQQRLTTCTILLAVLRNRLKLRDGEVPITDSPAALDEQFLLNKFAPPALRARLALRGTDDVYLQKLLIGQPLPDDPTNRVAANAAFFEQALANHDELEVLAGLRRLMIVSVSLKPGQDNPQLIFESLNSTGMTLTQADLVRNYVLMGHAEPQQSEWYQTYWYPLEQAFGVHYRASFDNFLRDFLTLELNPPRPLKLDSVYREFRNWYPAQLSADHDADAVAKLERMLRFGQHYCTFMFNPQTGGASEVGLRRVQKLVDVAAPAVMVLLERHLHDQVLGDNELVQALDLIESYVLRRSMVGAETRSGGQVFAALAQRITADQPLARLRAALVRQPKGAEFPDDMTFAHALKTQDLYGRRNLKFLLERLTNTGKEKVVTDNLTIEHVLPQKENLAPEWQAMLGPDWKVIRAQCVHKLGNLTLTGFNSELEARPFLEKKQHPDWGYVHSPVWLSKSIASQDTWGLDQIDSRGDLLAQKAIQVWRPPVADPAMLKTLELDDEKERSAAFSLAALKWAEGTREWFEELRATIQSSADGALELPRAKSVVYRAPDWIVEIIPRAKGFAVRLAADASDLIDIAPDVQDAAAWVFITNSTVSGGSLYSVSSPAQLVLAKALVARTCQLMFEPT